MQRTNQQLINKHYPVYNQQNIIKMIHELRDSRTKQQINRTQQLIKSCLQNEKNLIQITNMMISKDIAYEYKAILITFFSLLVQSLLSRYQLIKSKAKQKYTNSQFQQLRKQIISTSNKIQKILDCNTFYIKLKPSLINLALKLHNRSKQDWDCSRIVNKLQFYYRKEQIIIANTFFDNIIKLGYSIRQKVESHKKAMHYLPICASNALLKILKGQGNAQSQFKSGAYADFMEAFKGMDTMLQSAYTEISKQIMITWCNSDLVIQTLKIIAQYLKNEELGLLTNNDIKHPINQTKEWAQIILSLFKKMSDYVHHHHIQNLCLRFINVFESYVNHKMINFYMDKSIAQPQKYEYQFGQYLPIFINAARLKILPKYYFYSKADLQQNKNNNNQNLSFTSLIRSKMHVIQNHVLPIYSYFFMRINQFLAADSTDEFKNQLMELFSELCSIQQLDYDSDNVSYNIVLLFLTVLQSDRQLGYFIKKFINCCLFSYPFTSIPNSLQNTFVDYEWQIQQEIQILKDMPNQLYGNLQYKVQIGMILSMLLYPYLNKDRRFVQKCLNVFVDKITIQSINTSSSIFNTSIQTQSIFLLLLRNWMQQFQISIKSFKMRIQSFKYSTFVSNLCKINYRQSWKNFNKICVSFLVTYIKQSKQLVIQYKNSKLYLNFCNTLSFPQLQIPLKQFYQYQSNIPAQYCCQLYVDLLDYQIFKIQGQSIESTLKRLEQALIKMMQYNQSGASQANIRGILRVMCVVVSCQYYVPIFSNVFKWVLSLVQNKKILNQYQDQVVDFCLVLLDKYSLMAALQKNVLNIFWKIIYHAVSIYEWVSQTLDQTQNNSFSIKAKQIPTRFKYLLLLYLTSTFIVPTELLELLYKKSSHTLTCITAYILQSKRKLCISKSRPYQPDEMAHLLILHKIIMLRHEQFSQQTISKFLQLFWNNFMYRKQFPEQFNYVNGKYNIILFLLMKYNFQQFMSVVSQKESGIIHQIFYEICYNDNQYRIDYDSPLFVVTAIDVVSHIWNPKYSEMQTHYILKYAHFIFGGFVLCLDRIYQNYRYSRQENLQISVLSSQLKNIVQQTDLSLSSFISYLTKNEAQLDQFTKFRQFYQRTTNDVKVYRWFISFMDMYAKNTSYILPYQNILAIKKIKRKDGLTIYRIQNKCKQMQDTENKN